MKSVRVIREEKGYSQKELAKELRITRQYLGRIENGLVSPRLELIEEMAGIFNVEISALIREKEAV